MSFRTFVLRAGDQCTITFTPMNDGTTVSIDGPTVKAGIVSIDEARAYWKKLRENNWRVALPY